MNDLETRISTVLYNRIISIMDRIGMHSISRFIGIGCLLYTIMMEMSEKGYYIVFRHETSGDCISMHSILDNEIKEMEINAAPHDVKGN